MLEKRGEVEQAILEAQRLLKLYPNPELALICLKLIGNLHKEGIGGYLNLVNGLVEMFKNDSNIWNTYSKILRKLERFEEAVNACKKALELSANRNSDAIVNCGFAYKSWGNKLAESGEDLKKIEKYYEQADNCFKKAIQLARKIKKRQPAINYGLGQLYYNWAMVLKEKGGNKESIRSKLELSKQNLEKALKYHLKKNVHRLNNLIFLVKVLQKLQELNQESKEDFEKYFTEARKLYEEIKDSIPIHHSRWIEEELRSSFLS
jgi:tetratricopeptide (TPR) repeat protein